jgi:hypothetical protein
MRRGIRVQTLVLTAVLTGVAGFLVGVVITRDGSLLPRTPVVAGLVLVVMAGIVLWLARGVRRYLQGRATASLDPLHATRTVVLAQAAALTGAAAAGWFVGELVVLVRDLSLVANQERVLPVVVMLAASLVLAVAGMVAQHWCRVEPPDDSEDDEA